MTIHTRLIPLLVTLLTLWACHEEKTNTASLLLGKWQIEGKEEFEQWEIDEDGEMVGKSFKIESGQEIVWETMSIHDVAGKLSLLATVPTQNDGKAITFLGTIQEGGYLLFANPAHDFPQRIEYCPAGTKMLRVSVLGKGHKSYTYTLHRSKD